MAPVPVTVEEPAAVIALPNGIRSLAVRGTGFGATASSSTSTASHGAPALPGTEVRSQGSVCRLISTCGRSPSSWPVARSGGNTAPSSLGSMENRSPATANFRVS